MTFLTRWSLRYRWATIILAVIVLSLGVLGLGVLGLIRLQQELLPNIKFPVASHRRRHVAARGRG